MASRSRANLRVAAGLLLALLLGLVAAALQPTRSDGGDVPLQVEAAEAPDESAAAPVAGWVPVRLPDRWSQRWPTHDGSVWYRVRWHAPAAVPTAILVDGYRSAAAAWLNGSLVHLDPQLAEPLSQNQYRARLWTVDAPLVRAGDNTLLIRIVGYAPSWSGLGVVQVGAPAAITRLYERALRWRYDAQFGNIGVCLACGVVCLSFWLFRRHESSYGWTAAGGFAWTGYEWSIVAHQPWPFETSLGLMLFKTGCILAAVAVNSMALARIAGVRLPRLERVLLVATAATVGLLVAVPASTAMSMRIAVQSAAGALCAGVQIAFVVHTLYRGRLRGACGVIAGLTILVLPFIVQDTLATASSVEQRWFILPEIVPLFLVAMSVTLTARLASSLQASERFNEELQERVLQARDQLSQVLELQREREVSEARRSERQQLLHDLHDGLGGTLVGNITALEAGGVAPSAEQILTVLRDARDDLRLVIDTNFNAPERSFVAAMATLRHRLTGRLERQGVHAIWDVSGLRLFDVDASQVLELTRILQELVTNAVRHGRATEVRVALIDRDGVLGVEVSDNGRGFDPATSSAGIGLKGLHMRAARLGGHAEVLSDPRGTTVRVRTAIGRRSADPHASAGSRPSA